MDSRSILHKAANPGPRRMASINFFLSPVQLLKFDNVCEKNNVRRADVLRALVTEFLDGQPTA